MARCWVQQSTVPYWSSGETKVDRLDELDLGSSLLGYHIYLSLYLSRQEVPLALRQSSSLLLPVVHDANGAKALASARELPGRLTDFPSLLLDNGRGRPTTSTANLNHKNTLDHHPLFSPKTFQALFPTKNLPSYHTP